MNHNKTYVLIVNLNLFFFKVNFENIEMGVIRIKREDTLQTKYHRMRKICIIFWTFLNLGDELFYRS